jgi:hypothetical protein
MKIMLRLVHISDKDETIMYEEDIGAILADRNSEIIGKALELAKIINKENDERLRLG